MNNIIPSKEQQPFAYFSPPKESSPRLSSSGSDDRVHKLNTSCRDVNIAVFGAKNVGKSAMIVRFLTNRFIGDYDPNMEAIFSNTISVDGKHYCVHIMDTANQSFSQEIKDNPMIWADGFLLVFSLTDVASYRTVQELIHSVRKVRDDGRTPIVVVANKSDLVHLRAVSVGESEAWLTDIGCLFCEVSVSEDPESVMNAFICLLKHIRAINKKREKLYRTIQRPAAAAKLQIRQSLKNLAERTWRTRTFTF